jgi:hypothetical protein
MEVTTDQSRQTSIPKAVGKNPQNNIIIFGYFLQSNFEGRISE